MTVAEVPVGWSLVRIGDLLTFKNGLNKGKAFFGFGTPIVNYMDVFDHAGLFREDIAGLVDVTNAEKRAYSARKGDVFFTRTSEITEEIGVSAVLMDNLDDAVFSGFVLRGRPHNNRLSSNLAQYCFGSRVVRDQIVSSATYTTRALTNGRTLSNVVLPLPNDPREQEAIAEALSDADGVIEGLERLIAKKRLIKQGAMQDLLTARRRLPGFLGEWEVHRLRALLKSPPSYGINAAAVPLGSSGHDYLRITDIDDFGRLRRHGRAEVLDPFAAHFFLDRNDIVVARTGASTGKAHLYRGRPSTTVFAGFLIRLSPSPEAVEPSFLYETMQTQAYWDWISENSARSGQPGVNGQQLASLRVRVPKQIKEQKEIARVLTDMDAEIATLEARLDKARMVKEGMMQNLLTGRVRLV